MALRERVAYLAGLFDGEGCIQVRQGGTGRTTERTFRLEISVTNTDMALLDFCATFGGSIQSNNAVSRIVRGWRRQWNWRVYGQEAINLLAIIEPFLRGSKRCQAQMAMEFWAQRDPNESRGRVSDEEYALRLGYRLCLDHLRAS